MLLTIQYQQPSCLVIEVGGDIIHSMIIPECIVQIPQYVVPNVCPIYTISNLGKIFNTETNHYLPQNQDYHKNKYITIRLKLLDGSHIYAQHHRIILMTFNYIQGCESLDVNHKDGIKYHNWLSNLEWMTRSENIQHALQNNLFNVGETRNNSILSNSDVEKICKLISQGKTNKEIIDIMNIHNCNLSSIIQNIKNGHSWTHISNKYDLSNMWNKNKFTNDQIHLICKYFETYGKNKSYKDVLRYLDIDVDSLSNNELNILNNSISGIRSKKTFKEICIKYNY